MQGAQIIPGCPRTDGRRAMVSRTRSWAVATIIRGPQSCERSDLAPTGGGRELYRLESCQTSLHKCKAFASLRRS